MEFDVSKCQVLSVTNKKNKITHDYKLHDQELQTVSSTKYLGVEFSHNLKWDKHIAQMTSKANSTSAFIWRNLKGCPKQTQIHAYTSLVRPILEYASVVWDPHLKKDEKAVEMTQKRAMRRICQDYSNTTSATKLVASVGLETLKSRRKVNKITVFKTIHDNESCLKLPESIRQMSRTTRGHNVKLSIPAARRDAYLHSFFPSATRIWNNLPREAIESKSLENFRNIVKISNDHSLAELS